MFSRDSSFLLAIDIGNTSIALGLFKSVDNPSLLKFEKLALSRATQARIADAFRKVLGSDNQGRAVLSSVAPAQTRAIVSALRHLGIPFYQIRPDGVPGFSALVDNPSKVGSDRIANAFAAWALLKRPVAVVDCGSATTISLVDEAGFRGGAILPGLTLMRNALTEHTAKLPSVSLTDTSSAAVGTNTKAAILSGILYGTAGALDRIIAASEKELKKRLFFVLTGGHANLISPLLLRKHRIIPDLTLQGLRLIRRRLDLSHQGAIIR
ncbi:MAG TPA: type III pantothenate kinase [Dissulfurispiraceae bacterium]|nr:type III pantothenate kinase [Dissulfurispiraceae bacterium]